MIIDMNSDGVPAAEVAAYPDWPFAPPPRTPLREEVIVRGSTSAGVTLVGQGTADQYEPPRK